MKTLNIPCNLSFFCLFLINWRRRRNLYGSKNRDLLTGFLFLAQGMTCVLNCININKHNWKKKPASNNKPNKGCEMLKRYYFRNKMWASSSCTCLISFYNRFRVAWHVATWHKKKKKSTNYFYSLEASIYMMHGSFKNINHVLWRLSVKGEVPY